MKEGEKLYQKYLELLNKHKIKTADVCRATKIHPSTFTDWKKGKSKPKIDKIQKIADFFGVAITEFLGSEGD